MRKREREKERKSKSRRVSGQQYPIDHPTNLPDERGTSYPTIVARLEHKLAILGIEGASPDGLIPPISILYFNIFLDCLLISCTI